MKAVILANGEFPQSQSLITELKEAEFLAVCDGAMEHLECLGIVPNVIVGDLDSLDSKLKNKYQSKIIHLKEQESNDLSKTFFYCVSLGLDEFVVLGATGKREDHTLGNISLLCEYQKHCKSIVIKSDYGEFQVYSLPACIPSHKGEQISLFCPNPLVKLTSLGLKYPLVSLALPLWANGTLNESMGESFSLSANEETQIIIYRECVKN